MFLDPSGPFPCPRCGANKLTVTRGSMDDPTYVIPHTIPIFQVLCWQCGEGGNLDVTSVEAALVGWHAGINIVWTGHIDLSDDDRRLLGMDG